jgi:hypothetical protein
MALESIGNGVRVYAPKRFLRVTRWRENLSSGEKRAAHHIGVSETSQDQGDCISEGKAGVGALIVRRRRQENSG